MIKAFTVVAGLRLLVFPHYTDELCARSLIHESFGAFLQLLLPVLKGAVLSDMWRRSLCYHEIGLTRIHHLGEVILHVAQAVIVVK